MTDDTERGDAYRDPLAYASHLEERERQAAIAVHRANSKPEQEPNEYGEFEITECVDCGEDIGEFRVSLGKVRCITCQELKERNSQFRGAY